MFWQCVYYQDYFSSGGPDCFFKFQNFLTQVFCKWRFLLGSIGALMGLRDTGQQRRLLLWCREPCLALYSRDPWYIQGEECWFTGSTGRWCMYHLLLRKSSVGGLRQTGGVSQIGYVYPELLLKNVQKFLV